MKVDRSHLDDLERQIAPPMKMAITLPLVGQHGISIYVAAGTFSLEPCGSSDVREAAHLIADAVDAGKPEILDIVFDGPPGHTAGRFVEVEDANGKSVNAGEWIDRGDGMWALRIVSRRGK